MTFLTKFLIKLKCQLLYIVVLLCSYEFIYYYEYVLYNQYKLFRMHFSRIKYYLGYLQRQDSAIVTIAI